MLEALAGELALQGGQVSVSGCAEPLPVKPLAFKRCLANLVENAVFYGRRAEVTLIDTPERLAIAIRDHGPGIPEAQHERVFAPFVRLEPSRSRNTGGSGLGLGISRHIARAMGGEIALANHPEGGLEVTIFLPRPGNVTAL